jgi:hypothetical protein
MAIFIASRTFSKLYSGSPMPISTMLDKSRGPLAGADARLRPFVKIVARHHDLAHDFARREVAHQLLRAGMAERTGQRAPHLGGDAQRAAIGFGDIDDLDLMPPGDAGEVFARAICTDLFRDHLGDFDHELLGQLRAIGLGEVRHLGKIAHAPLIDPLPDLVHPHLGLLFRRAMGDQRLAQRLAGEADEVHGPLGQLAGDGQHILCDRGGIGHGAHIARLIALI